MKINIREPVHWACWAAERRIGSWQKNLPTKPQVNTGNEVGPSQKPEGGETKHRPRRSDAPGLELALLDHRLEDIIHPKKPGQRSGIRHRSYVAHAFPFRSPVAEITGQFGQILRQI